MAAFVSMLRRKKVDLVILHFPPAPIPINVKTDNAITTYKMVDDSTTQVC